MWFKSIQPYALSEPVAYDPEAFSAELACVPWIPCSGVVPETAGFVAPIGGEGAPLAYGAQHMILFCLKIQKKALSSAAVREQHEAKVAELELKQGRSLAKDEIRRLKEDLHATMLGQAFPVSTKVYAMIDTRTNRLMVDTVVAKQLDTLLTLLGKVFPEQSITPYPLVSPPAIMTRWLMNNAYPDAITLADSCVLADADENQGVVRFTRKDLSSSAVERLLNEGNQVMQLAINWQGQLQCQIRRDFSFSSIKYADSIRETAKEYVSETPEERFATDFVLMSEAVTAFIDSLLPCFLDDATAPSRRIVEDTVEVTG